MLTTIGVLVAVALLMGGLLCWRSAPAVSAACVGGLVLGACAVYLAVKQPTTDAPGTIALSVSGGLGLAGLVGLLARPRGNARRLRAAGITSLVAAPPLAVALWVLLATACPMYVQGRRAGLCRYGEDVLGGWLGPTAALAGLDVVAIGLLLLVSARIAPRASTDE